MVEPIRIDDPTKLPDTFLLLPERWEATLEQIKRLTPWKLGDVFIYETPMGKTTWKIIGVEVLNAQELQETDEVGKTDETV